MKFYLLIPLLFLGAFCLPVLGFTQENPSNQHPLTTETPSDNSSTSEYFNEYGLKNYPEYNEEPEIWPNPIEHESDTFEAKFFNMLFILGLLIGFMLLASWALKRMMRTKVTQLNTANSIKILETRYLSPRATLYLVQVQDQAFLIAESPTQMTYLATLPLEDEESLSSQSKS